jgi:hypothetical protein
MVCWAMIQSDVTVAAEQSLEVMLVRWGVIQCLLCDSTEQSVWKMHCVALVCSKVQTAGCLSLL